MTTYGLLIFDQVEELDFAGPWEVFTASSRLRGDVDTAVLVAETPDVVRCAKGLRVLPDHTVHDHPALDVLLVPGGYGARVIQPHNPVVTEWIAGTAATAAWTTGVCTGAFLLHAAGVARGRRVATHWKYEDDLERLGEVTVVRDARYVVSGNLVTSQGVSAGIDSALWLVGALHGRDHARAVRRVIQYDPAPPYLADEPLTVPGTAGSGWE
ncbi:DJ-1/PfpI family protein [Nocardia goodfellowii]|uniref:Transcriptional regulator GlxA family with amidase domain n=1 Tax=Nocardia goodfellowii TaxID=882446 RepID=A0ABS4QQ41_9NOCA|nr:DJ-1/PfpI family protein [Nocardia goodfellowii]MBP2193265.1 transcriptional regulator GlxA family with amidase domain [Nocardia goodfellowii]